MSSGSDNDGDIVIYYGSPHKCCKKRKDIRMNIVPIEKNIIRAM